MNQVFLLAPLQGITDFTFRNLLCKYFKGIDRVYSPFLRLQNDKTLKKSQITDVLPPNNEGSDLIPQILCNTAEDFISMAKILIDFGYSEVNWNLGCPYPMVAKRQLGSGLLPFPDVVDEILNKTLPSINCKISIKVRAGYENAEDLYKLIPVINKYEISELIIHPRIGKQMYKGVADPSIVENCLKFCNKSIAYNGDIVDIDSFINFKNRFSEINHWMIGRALISNPFLVEEIILGKRIDSKLKMERFSEFHDELFEFYRSYLSGPGHIINKMMQLWEYFSKSFSNSHKVFKSIKKAKSIEKYNSAIQTIFNSEEFV